MPLDREFAAALGTERDGLRPLPTLTLRGQVKADVPIIMHDAVELAVTGLTEAEGSPAVQLPALSVEAYLWGRRGGGREGPSGHGGGGHCGGPDHWRPQAQAPGHSQGCSFLSHPFPTGASCSLIHSVDRPPAPRCVHSEGSAEKSRSLPSKDKVWRGNFQGGTTRQLLPGPLPGVQEGRAPQNARG